MPPLPPIHGAPKVSLPVETNKAATPNDAQPVNPFKAFIAQTNDDQVKSDQAIRDLVVGKNDNIQQVVMQVAKSEMSFQLFMEVRDQVIESYNELMRMQF